MLEARAKYREYVARLLQLGGDGADEAAAAAGRVLRFETALARATLTRVERRDPHNVYHRVTIGQLRALTPSFGWPAYLRAAGKPTLRVLDVSEPAFLLEVESLLEDEPLSTWKEYLRARLVDARAPYLSRAFQRAAFDFHAAYLNGVKEEQPRWKKCVGWVDRDLGDALGEMFVARVFPPAVKGQVVDMTRRIKAAMAARIRESDWMSEATRRAALEKLAAMRDKIGYPARWRDYGALRIERAGFAGDVLRAARFETARQLAKIGRPVDRDEWDMTAPTVNAYYDPQRNDINFPAGVLLPPLWDPRMDLAPGYGNTGGTIGHELTHGFDDEGRQFDARGNLRDWWTPGDAEAFRSRAACVDGAVRAVPGGRRPEDQLAAHAGRGHRRPGRRHPGLDGLEGRDARPGARAAGRPRAGPAVLRRDWPSGPARTMTDARKRLLAQHRSPLAVALARERPGGQHSRVPAGVLLPGRLVPGAGEGLQGVVKRPP